MNYKTLVAAIGAAALTTGTTLADVIAVGTGKTHTFTNTADVVQTDAVRVSDRATLVQQGGGKTTLKSGTFVENKPVAVNVAAGSVRLEASEPLLATYAKPTDVLNKAAFWVDASETASLKLREGTKDVETWLDVRETGAGTELSPYLHTRAVAFVNDKLTAYPFQTNLLEKSGVYFRKRGSGCFMNWVNPDGSQQTISGIRHAFVVHGSTGDLVGDFLGQRKSTNMKLGFLRDGCKTGLWVQNCANAIPLQSARTYLNGVEVDAARTPYATTGETIYEVEVETDVSGGSLSAMCFFNDRDYQTTATDGSTTTDSASGKLVNPILGTTEQNNGGNRVGGEYLFEVVVFTNNLTAAERLAVSDWLNEKWRGVTPPAAAPAITVAMASNTVVEVGAVALAEGSAIMGDGTIRKTGDGAFTLRPTLETRNSALHAEVKGGTLNLGYSIPLTLAAGDTVLSTQRLCGTEIAVTASGADANRLVKNGDGPVTLDAIPAGVTRLDVNAGELRLSDPRAAQDIVAPAAEAVVVAFPDPGFETYPASTHTTWNSFIYDGQEANGWHAVDPDGTTDGSAVFFYDQSYGDPKSWGFVLQDPATGVLVVKNNASAWCEVEIPSDGDYVLTFRSAPRGSYTGEQLDVMIGDGADSLESFGDFKTKTQVWQTFAFPKKHLTAGKKQFWLKSKDMSTDRCTQFDDFLLTRVPNDASAWELPNGDFEIRGVDFNAGAVTAANAGCVPGYEVAQRTDMTTSLSEADLTTFSPKGCRDNMYYNIAWDKDGGATQFMMTGEGCTLKTTFTPPAGTWRFRADFCAWATDYRTSASGYSVAAAIAPSDGSAIDLGTVSTNAHALLARTWPNAFTADGTTSFTLTLTGAGTGTGEDKAYVHGLLDNLSLVRETENLFADGGFEAAALPWSFDVTAKPSGVSGSSAFAYSHRDYLSHYAFGTCEGAKCLKLVNDDAVYQSVTFATGGLYRVSAAFMSRCAPGTIEFGTWGNNPVSVYFARNGETNVVGTTDNAATTNFNEYAYYVQVPDEGGTWDVGFRGTSVWDGGKSVDRTMLVDAAQLYRVETEASIGLPKELEITVAKGAKLALDFDGTCEVARLRLGGRNYSGIVSLETHPELSGLISGRGAFFVRPKGLMLIIR